MSSLPLTEFVLGERITDIAIKWGARIAGPAEHQTVVSDIPTLILAGEFDQNTPSYWGKLAGRTLANSYFIEVPGAGHGVIKAGICVLSMVKKFFDSPLNRPDETWVKALTEPTFELPGENHGQ